MSIWLNKHRFQLRFLSRLLLLLRSSVSSSEKSGTRVELEGDEAPRWQKAILIACGDLGNVSVLIVSRICHIVLIVSHIFWPMPVCSVYNMFFYSLFFFRFVTTSRWTQMDGYDMGLSWYILVVWQCTRRNRVQFSVGIFCFIHDVYIYVINGTNGVPDWVWSPEVNY